MNYKYSKKLNIGDIVIVSPKSEPASSFSARVEQVVSCETVDRNNRKSVSYEYSVRTIFYEKDPFKNFPMLDTNFLTWSELSNFSTIDEYINNMNYFMNGVIEFKKIEIYE
jgi:hypothetical protein